MNRTIIRITAHPKLNRTPTRAKAYPVKQMQCTHLQKWETLKKKEFMLGSLTPTRLFFGALKTARRMAWVHEGTTKANRALKFVVLCRDAFLITKRFCRWDAVFQSIPNLSLTHFTRHPSANIFPKQRSNGYVFLCPSFGSWRRFLSLLQPRLSHPTTSTQHLRYITHTL